VNDSSRPPTARGSSVRQDWCCWLPEEKALVFRMHEQHLESLYNMFSVALNEAIELRQRGYLCKSLMAIGMTADLGKLFTVPLAGMLHALYDHAKHYGLVPNAAPLDAANYRGLRGQRSARMSSLLSRVLLTQRLQFLQKVTTLEEMVEDLDGDFRAAALELADGLSIAPRHAWEAVDAVHYDLNTCLRETLVLFKSFLVVLPANQLPSFQKTVCKQWEAPGHACPVPQRAAQHRRMAAFARE
jgi:hypothetical protein